MKISVTSLSDYQRGGAWPSSVRTVKRSVKSDNERDPHLYLRPSCPHEAHHRETAGVKPEEGAGNDRSVCPECLGLHALQRTGQWEATPRGGATPKPVHSSDRGL